MRKLQILAMALFVAFAFSVVVAASASAVEWLDNGAAIGAAVKVDSETEVGNLLLLEDMKTGVELLCSGTDEGTVGPGKADEITKITATGCVTDKGFCSNPEATPVNLPWKTELLEPVAGVWRDDISNATNNPGWDIKCGGILVDECVGNSDTLITNVSLNLVDSLFDAGSPAAKCLSALGEGEWLVEGLIFMLASEAGHDISVS
jgi:hypothetical protein